MRAMRSSMWLGMMTLAACSGSHSHPGDAADAPIDQLIDQMIDAPTVTLGPDIELPLLGDPVADYQHSAEVTLAAHGGRVVVAMINMHFDSATTFGTTTFSKRVATVSSDDRGDHYGAAIDPGAGDQTTDPVVRVDSAGTFWLTTWDTSGMAIAGSLSRSTDGATWNVLKTDIPYADKQWHVADPATSRVYVGAAGGFWTFDFAGTQIASYTTTGAQMANATLDATGVRFGTLDHAVLHWDGTASAPAMLGPALPSGSTPDLYTTACWSLGLTAAGTEWSVSTTKDGDRGAVVVYLRTNLSGGGTGQIISAPDATAFLPAGVIDAQGRLHVVWYDSAGPQAKLVYRRSLTSDLSGAYTPEVALDDNAAPGNRWYPFFDSAAGGRRLREYIDIAADGDRIHVVWTHAPIAPSRVHARWIEPS
jgi:hypothetical protein